MENQQQYDLKNKAFKQILLNNNPDALLEYLLTIVDKYVINKLRGGDNVDVSEYEALMFIPNHIKSEVEKLRKK
jgi:hypothetical protein